MTPTDDPLVFLTQVMNDPAVELRMRADVAKALLPFKHQKLGEGGKKESLLEAARAADAGPFGAPPPPPRLVAGGKK